MYKRSETLGIKLKVIIALAFFKTVEFEIKERDFCYQMKEDLNNWAKSKKFKFLVKNIQKPYYIKGHAAYLMNENERYKILSFSR